MGFSNVTAGLMLACAAVLGGLPVTDAQAQDRTDQFAVVDGMSQTRWQTSGYVLREAGQSIGPEITALVRMPLDYKREFMWGALGIGALILVDRPVTEFYQDHVETALDGFALPSHPLTDKLDIAGLVDEDWWLITGVAGLYGYGLVADDTRAQRAAILSAKAMAYSFVTTQVVLKTAFGRKRPYADLSARGDQEGDVFTTDPLDFGNHSGVSLTADGYGSSMPSYHFTQYFSVAHVVSRSYDNSWVPYGLATVLAASNIRGHRHWVSDMAAGTLLGLGIGEVLWQTNQNMQERRVTFEPQVSRDRVGLTMTMEF